MRNPITQRQAQLLLQCLHITPGGKVIVPKSDSTGHIHPRPFSSQNAPKVIAELDDVLSGNFPPNEETSLVWKEGLTVASIEMFRDNMKRSVIIRPMTTGITPSILVSVAYEEKSTSQKPKRQKPSSLIRAVAIDDTGIPRHVALSWFIPEAILFSGLSVPQQEPSDFVSKIWKEILDYFAETFQVSLTTHPVANVGHSYKIMNGRLGQTGPILAGLMASKEGIQIDISPPESHATSPLPLIRGLLITALLQKLLPTPITEKACAEKIASLLGSVTSEVEDAISLLNDRSSTLDALANFYALTSIPGLSLIPQKGSLTSLLQEIGATSRNLDGYRKSIDAFLDALEKSKSWEDLERAVLVTQKMLEEYDSWVQTFRALERKIQLALPPTDIKIVSTIPLPSTMQDYFHQAFSVILTEFSYAMAHTFPETQRSPGIMS